MCIRRTKRRGVNTYSTRVVYLIDEKQLTKDCGGMFVVMGRAEMWWTRGEGEGKTFSHRRSDFPSERPGVRVGVDQRPGKLQGYKVVAFAMLHP